MNKSKIVVKSKKENAYPHNVDDYDHYLALDWSMNNMSVARLTKKMTTPKVIDVPSNIRDLKDYLKELKGKKILTIEETTTSQWLFVELYDQIDKMLICDPHRNRLLSEGPKTDKIDAGKLCLLLRNGMMKEVYHTTSSLHDLRLLVSRYEDVIKSGVMLINQKSAIYRAENKSHKKDKIESKNKIQKFVLSELEEEIDAYETRKHRFKKEFEKIRSKNKIVRNLSTIPGIGLVSSIMILSSVIDPKRFKSPNHYLSYCGLVKHDKLSGGRSYGKRTPRYSRRLKSVYRSAAVRCLQYNNPIKEYYEYLIREKNISDKKARILMARYIAKISLAVMREGKKYKGYQPKENILKDKAA